MCPVRKGLLTCWDFQIELYFGHFGSVYRIATISFPTHSDACTRGFSTDIREVIHNQKRSGTVGRERLSVRSQDEKFKITCATVFPLRG